jgi:hypothetical protein
MKARRGCQTRFPLPLPNNRCSLVPCQARRDSAREWAQPTPETRRASTPLASYQTAPGSRPGPYAAPSPRVEKATPIWYHYRRGELAERLKAVAC